MYNNYQCQNSHLLIGITCEITIEICGPFQHYCLNGGLCVNNSDEYTLFLMRGNN